MEKIFIGASLKIKRSDGRIHNAVVSRWNPEAHCVGVEWLETNGDVKGKEFDLEFILSLNPELRPTDNNVEVQHLALGTAAALNSVGAPGGARSAGDAGDPGVAEGAWGGGNDQSTGCLTSRLTISKISEPSCSGLAPQASISQSVGNIFTASCSKDVQGAHGLVNTGLRRTRYLNSSIATLAGGNRNRNSVINSQCIAPTTTTATAAAAPTATTSNNNSAFIPANAPAGHRPSMAYKEMERLKENREKRRAHHAEMREEKVALMNQDPGNPNWETAQMIREYKNTLQIEPLVDGHLTENHQISVCVRKRPLNRKELNLMEIDVISVPRKDVILVHEPRTKVDLTKFLEHHKFRFDYAFNEICDNAIVYKYTAKPLVKTIFEGGKATCFAYGQTGSGKTHTMGGGFDGKQQNCENGIYAMAANDIFITLKSPQYASLKLIVTASFYEIYSNKVFDLLANKQKLCVMEDYRLQVNIVGLTEKVVGSVEEVLKFIKLGNAARSSGQTSANASSSRSHAIFQIALYPMGSPNVHGKFSFIDLAGNERGVDNSTGDRQTRLESAEINRSLLALKECIRALGKQSMHLPFRDSKLTHVLRDSFVGAKSKTCMIAMISPGLSCCEHSLNTLRYADRVKELIVKEVPGGEPNEVQDDDETENLTDQTLNASNASSMDIELISSLSELDMSDAELVVEQQANDNAEQVEQGEDVVDCHRRVNATLEIFLAESKALYELTNNDVCDQEAYCTRGETMFSTLHEIAKQCRDMMTDARKKLAKK